MAQAQQLINLSELLLSAEHLPWQSELFLPTGRVWTEDTKGAVLDTEDVEDPDNPPFAVTYGLSCALGVSEIQDVVNNARQQDPNAGAAKLLQAFQFYHDNDAFIDFHVGTEPA